jgi:hypothetical protein
LSRCRNRAALLAQHEGGNKVLEPTTARNAAEEKKEVEQNGREERMSK